MTVAATSETNELGTKSRVLFFKFEDRYHVFLKGGVVLYIIMHMKIIVVVLFLKI